ncbi:hypothetical protein KHP62_01305 [Rhodobacteraceae bacterium NNCM2]|nr:hypothetical protein [Coraliihabitans acroporae]
MTNAPTPSLQDLVNDCDERLLAVLAAGMDWIWETDAEHRFTFLSTEMQGATNAELMHLLGQRRIDLMPDDDENRAARQAHMDDLENHRPVVNFEYHLLSEHVEGGSIWCLVNGFPVFGEDGTFLGYRGGARRIDEMVAARKAQQAAEQELREMNATLEERIARRTRELEESNARLREREAELEAARQRAETINQAKTDFVANISHELRTPLSGIIGTNLLLQQTALNDRQKELARMQGNSANVLLELVNSLLDLARIEAQEIRLMPEEIDTEGAIAEAVSMVSSAANDKNIDVEVVTRPGRPDIITTDPDRFRQIILNLLSNAIKFSGSDQRVVVSLGPCGENGLRVEVKDNGTGIDEKDLGLVFERFHRASTCHPGSGTGLGLAICKQLVEVMHGRIGVESRLGEGALFWVELPPSPGTQAAS